ncbi:MAG: ABC transporter ATP-binding protein [Clostridia bacterium]|nr:ABC transporter ATP-binding protein [Clostridia bacterium]
MASSAHLILKIEHLSKSFGETEVIRDLSFEVAAGEFLTILGASGCGKTTLLRMICGLEEADEGKIILDGKDVTGAEPNHRAVNTVFQSYALFPHMNVYDNVAYPLKIARVQKDEIKQRVSEALALVQMEGYERRYPSEMSGGQKQRVAIARAVIGQPKILLLDEPLGALDLNLRHAMQGELKNLQKRLGITFLYITHDQEEALNMSDRIAVMRGGSFLQIGTPSEVYDSPKNVYAARFIGEANILPCVYEDEIGGRYTVKFGDNKLILRGNKGHYTAGDLIFAAVRGEKILVSAAESGGIPATVKDLNFAGGVMRITAEALGTKITAMRYGLDRSIELGQQVWLEIPELAGAAVEE